jgi:glutamine synthetase
MASQIVAGWTGLTALWTPDPSADRHAPALPRSLIDALEALRANACFQDNFGKLFVDYFCRPKEAEVSRFLSEVTDWEQREYFSLL